MAYIQGDTIEKRLRDAVNQMCEGSIEPKDAKIIVDVLINTETYLTNIKPTEETPRFAQILQLAKESK